MTTAANLHGIHVAKLPSLRALLRDWIAINSRMASEWIDDGDVPWWYNERSSLGIFAGAVWQNKGWVFQEYGIDRKIKHKNNTRIKQGRRDIDFRIGAQYYTGEAKQCWPTFGRPEQTAPLIKASLSKACDEAAQLSIPGYTQLGIVFAVPRVPVKRRAETRLILHGIIDDLKKIPSTTLAWYFLGNDQSPRGSQEWSKNYAYPGVILAIRPIRLGRVPD